MKAPATDCRECHAAQFRVVHQWYEVGCPDCEVRELAYLKGDDLSRELDEIERKRGLSARHGIYERVKVEKARIAALSAAMPRRERTT